MEYKKAELTDFARQCARGARYMILGLCMAEEIAHTSLAREIISNNTGNEDLLLEISKRYANYADDMVNFRVDNAATQDFQELIDRIVICCDEHDWFE